MHACVSSTLLDPLDRTIMGNLQLDWLRCQVAMDSVHRNPRLELVIPQVDSDHKLFTRAAERSPQCMHSHGATDPLTRCHELKPGAHYRTLFFTSLGKP